MKLYISDLDGTLLNDKMSLSEDTVSILNNLIAEGLNFSFATARSFDSVEKIVKPLNLNLPFVIYNGVVVYDPVSKTYLRKNTLDKSLAHSIIEEVEALNPFVFVSNVEDGNHIFFKKIINDGQSNFINSPVNKGDKRFKTIESYLDLEYEEYISIACIDTKENLLKFYEKYKNNEQLQIHLTEDVYDKEYYWLEFAKKGSTKKDALLFLKEYLNINKLVTFGDNLNDLSMFSIADECYAVENAHLDLKKVATEIIGKNIDDAVAKKIESDFNILQVKIY